MLEHRVGALELQLARASAGPALTLDALVADYQALRRQAVRFVRLHVAADMEDKAVEVIAEGSFRALREVVVDEALSPGQWDLRAA